MTKRFSCVDVCGEKTSLDLFETLPFTREAATKISTPEPNRSSHPVSQGGVGPGVALEQTCAWLGVEELRARTLGRGGRGRGPFASSPALRVRR